VKSDCFKGFDIEVPIKFTVEVELEKEIFVHPDDLELDK
jgi:hypothetical protein